MAGPSDPYTRFYWRFISEYPDIYADDAAFATWMRLLVGAEGSYPQSAPLPRSVDDAVLEVLRVAGLVELCAGDRYMVRGVTAERGRRKEQQTNGGVVRSQSAERGPDGRWLPAVESSAGPALEVQRSS